MQQTHIISMIVTNKPLLAPQNPPRLIDRVTKTKNRQINKQQQQQQPLFKHQHIFGADGTDVWLYIFALRIELNQI